MEIGLGKSVPPQETGDGDLIRVRRPPWRRSRGTFTRKIGGLRGKSDFLKRIGRDWGEFGGDGAAN